VTFADVAGVDEAKAELQEIVAFLKDPQGYGRLGARMPKGVLLVGPPGTGKTLLAKAVAGEAGVPFFSISGSEFVEMFVGVGAARVRDLFEQARKEGAGDHLHRRTRRAGPRARAAGPMIGGHDEREQTLNQLLVELDGFDSSSGLVLLAATNRPEILDPALLRAGRFDRQVLVDRPTRPAACRSSRCTCARSAGAGRRPRPGGGADHRLLRRRSGQPRQRGGAGRHPARRRRGDAGGLHHGHRAHRRRPREAQPRAQSAEREVVAYHEMGHALVALALPGTDPVHKVSIIPRGIGALGYTIQRPTEDRFLMTRAELEHKIMVLLGGRAAEKLVFGHLSTGAADDLAKVTDIARDMVMRYGMVEELGYVAYEAQRPRFLELPGPGGTARVGTQVVAVRGLLLSGANLACAQ
jgi:cell division protease FtsH